MHFQPDGELWGIERSNDGLVSIAGGVLVRDAQGGLVGAVGVCGAAAAATDREVAGVVADSFKHFPLSY